MNQHLKTPALKPSRRLFLGGTAAGIAGLSLGFSIPVADAEAAEQAPEVNAWIVIKPDDSVIIRIAR